MAVLDMNYRYMQQAEHRRESVEAHCQDAIQEVPQDQ